MLRVILLGLITVLPHNIYSQTVAPVRPPALPTPINYTLDQIFNNIFRYPNAIIVRSSAPFDVSNSTIWVVQSSKWYIEPANVWVTSGVVNLVQRITDLVSGNVWISSGSITINNPNAFNNIWVTSGVITLVQRIEDLVSGNVWISSGIITISNPNNFNNVWITSGIVIDNNYVVSGSTYVRIQTFATGTYTTGFEVESISILSRGGDNTVNINSGDEIPCYDGIAYNSPTKVKRWVNPTINYTVNIGTLDILMEGYIP